MNMSEIKLLNVKEKAKEKNVSIRTVENWVKRDNIEFFTLNKKKDLKRKQKYFKPEDNGTD